MSFKHSSLDEMILQDVATDVAQYLAGNRNKKGKRTRYATLLGIYRGIYRTGGKRRWKKESPFYVFAVLAKMEDEGVIRHIRRIHKHLNPLFYFNEVKARLKYL